MKTMNEVISGAITAPETAELFSWLRYGVLVLGGGVVSLGVYLDRKKEERIKEQTVTIEKLTEMSGLREMVTKQNEELRRLTEKDVEGQRLLAEKYGELAAMGDRMARLIDKLHKNGQL